MSESASELYAQRRMLAVGYTWGRMDGGDERFVKAVERHVDAVEFGHAYARAFAELERNERAYMPSVHDAYEKWVSEGLIP